MDPERIKIIIEEARRCKPPTTLVVLTLTNRLPNNWAARASPPLKIFLRTPLPVLMSLLSGPKTTGFLHGKWRFSSFFGGLGVTTSDGIQGVRTGSREPVFGMSG